MRLLKTAALAGLLALSGTTFAFADLQTWADGDRIYVKNTGSKGFYWSMCIRVDDRNWAETPNGYTPAYDISTVVLNTTAAYRWRVSSNTGNYPATPNC